MIYLDNAATTKPCDEAKAAVMKGLEVFGNPSSLHRAGLDAELLVSDAREIIADALGVTPDEVYFTSGATESNNTAIFGAYKAHGKRKKRVVISSVEHPAVKNPAQELEDMGCEVIRISPDENGEINARDIFAAVNEDTFLVSCMLVNNENGYILPVEKAFSMIKKKYPQVITHCDCVQGFMKIPVKAKKLNADMISLSGHKIYAPKGIGALYVKKGLRLPPLTFGGGQERGMRPGTEAVPNIAAFAKACEIRMAHFDEDYAHVQELADYLKQQVSAELPDAVINGAGDIPHVVNLSMPGCKSEVMLHVLEGDEVYISSGSACSKGKQSGVLKALGLPKARTDSALRVSFAPFNTREDVDAFVAAVKKGAKMFRR